MVKSTHNNAERAFANLFDNFVSVVNMVVVPNLKLLLISVKPIVSGLIDPSPFSPSREGWLLPLPLLAFLNIKVVDGLEFKDLFLFEIR